MDHSNGGCCVRQLFLFTFLVFLVWWTPLSDVESHSNQPDDATYRPAFESTSSAWDAAYNAAMAVYKDNEDPNDTTKTNVLRVLQNINQQSHGGHLRTLHSLGAFHQKQGLFEEALSYYKQALAHDPDPGASGAEHVPTY